MNQQQGDLAAKMLEMSLIPHKPWFQETFYNLPTETIFVVVDPQIESAAAHDVIPETYQGFEVELATIQEIPF